MSLSASWSWICEQCQTLGPTALVGSPKKIVFFDFDRTLTVLHVFKSLAGWVDTQVACCPTISNLVSAKHSALTERGQLRSLIELGPAWTEQVFGGGPRLAALRQLLSGLAKDPNCRVILVTRGFVGVAKKCLQQTGLLGYFDCVYGNRGCAYGEGTEWDELSADVAFSEADEALLGSDKESDWHAKWQIICQHMEQERLRASQVLFVDDDEDEVGSVSHAVRTQHVKGSGGLAAADVAAILQFVGVKKALWAARCQTTWGALRNPLASKPPAIVIFNRKHLQVRLSRHLAFLEEEFAACPNPLRRVKLLVKQPLLLYSVAHHEFVQHFDITGSRNSNLKAMQVVALGMQSMGLSEGCDDGPARQNSYADEDESSKACSPTTGDRDVPSSDSTEAEVAWPPSSDSHSSDEARFVTSSQQKLKVANPTPLSQSTPVGSLWERDPRLQQKDCLHDREASDDEDDDEVDLEMEALVSEGVTLEQLQQLQLTVARSRSRSSSASERTLGSQAGDERTSSKEKNLHLYQEPIGRTNSKHQSKMMATVVNMFHQTLLGLCPITMKIVSQRRNVVCCHDARHMSPETAVWSRYSKEEALGAGHFGEVFRATEVSSGHQVAIKQLDRLDPTMDMLLEADDDEQDACALEVHALRALGHPNLLRVYEVVQCEDYVYIISEMATGGTLSSYAQKNKIGSWISGAFQQIVSAVSYCHGLHVLHGDLKPENVLVCGQRPDGSPLCIVCDFGHATVCVQSAKVAAPGDPRYIAPEVVLEEGLSPKSDVYSLGVTAFELLTGGWLPFFNDQAVTLHMSYYKLKFGGIREAIVSQDGLPWQDLDRLRKAAPPPAREAVLSMLARKPRDRPMASQLQQSAWLQAAHGPCKMAYDTKLKEDIDFGWGLWVPQHPDFVEKLRTRSRCSWTCRMLLAVLGSGLPPEKVYGARLLFRRMDEGGDGTLKARAFRTACERVGMAREDADVLFRAGDLHNQGFMDFKNVMMLFLDLDSFHQDELVSLMRSALNRIRGPRANAAPEDTSVNVNVNADELDALLGQRPDPRMQRLLADIRTLLGPEETELTPDLLLRVLREDPFSQEKGLKA